MTAPDTIEIRKLRVTTHIGVPDEERTQAQQLLVTVFMTPVRSFQGLDDDIANTVDYAAVATDIQEFAAARPRKLIETLASETAARLLELHPLSRVEVLLEKFILPDTECVAVRVVREK